MKLTLEADCVFVRLDDPYFSLARQWKGATEDGTPVTALVICVSSRLPDAQPRIDGQLRGLPPPQLYVDSDEAAPMLNRRIA
jgi:hypothetical protein